MGKSFRFSDLNRADQKLVEEALRASARAYAPYSGFAVGATVRTTTGKLISGTNLENAAYPLGICAELCAVAAANALGEWRITAIAVVGHKFTVPEDTHQVVTPCGRCRQIIFEASQVSDCDIEVFSCNGALTEIIRTPISELLPTPFGPANLGLDKAWPDLRRKLEASVTQLLRHEHEPAD